MYIPGNLSMSRFVALLYHVVRTITNYHTYTVYLLENDVTSKNVLQKKSMPRPLDIKGCAPYYCAHNKGNFVSQAIIADL